MAPTRAILLRKYQCAVLPGLLSPRSLLPSSSLHDTLHLRSLLMECTEKSALRAGGVAPVLGFPVLLCTVVLFYFFVHVRLASAPPPDTAYQRRWSPGLPCA